MIADKLVGAFRRRLGFVYDRVRKPALKCCPICRLPEPTYKPLPDYHLQKMRDAGWPYGFDRFETLNIQEYQCPDCGASDRDRLCALYLNEVLADWQRRIAMVDFAPAKALSEWTRRTLVERGFNDSYRTADLWAEGVDDKVDITDLACYQSGTVDLFLCSHVLEHVADDRRAMRELHRILKSGGRGMLLVPLVRGLKEIDEDPTVTDVAERWRRFAQDDHVRLYSKREFLRRLREAGFVVREFGISHFGRRQFEAQAITESSVLYVVVKR
jgi:SAM-dependent methyltransferase